MDSYSELGYGWTDLKQAESVFSKVKADEAPVDVDFHEWIVVRTLPRVSETATTAHEQKEPAASVMALSGYPGDRGHGLATALLAFGTIVNPKAMRTTTTNSSGFRL